MSPVLSILVATLSGREALYSRLAASLWPQACAAGERVEVLTEADGGKMPLGLKRQALLNRARGEYVAYVDDDDLVSPDYVASILDAAESGADSITFDLRRSAPSGIEDWRFVAFGVEPGHEAKRDAEGRFLWMANHLCPVRRELAVQVPFLPITYLDDVAWYQTLHKAGLVRSEVRIGRPLYLYLWGWGGPTAAQSKSSVEATHYLLRKGLRACRHGPTGRIVVETEPALPLTPKRWGLVGGGAKEHFPLKSLTPFHVIRKV